MKLSLLATLTLLPCLALAQSTPDATPTPPPNPPPPDTDSKPWHHHPPPTPDQQIAWMTAKLGLSDTQQEQIKPLLVAREQQFKAIHENTSLTEDQKHEQMKALFESTDQQIQQLLNPAQVAQFKEMHQHHGPPPPPPPQ